MGDPSRARTTGSPSRAIGVVWALIGVTVLAEIAYPLTPGASRDRLTIGTVLVFFAASVLHAWVSRGLRTAGALVAVTAGGGLLVEAVGVATGFPFGSYHYAHSLGPMVFGVPWVIPLAWTMMAWPAWLVACRLVRRPATRIVVAGWALASWDVFLDPQMVHAGHWRWDRPSTALPAVSGVPAVPLTNYLAWFVVAVVMALLLSTLGGGEVHSGCPEDTAMYVVYLWTYASSVLAHAAFLGLGASALWGALAMGPVAIGLVVVLWRSRAVTSPQPLRSATGEAA